MDRIRKRLAVGVVLVVAALIGMVAVAAAADSRPDAAQMAQTTYGEYEGADDSAEDVAEGPDRPITGPDLERASAAALAYVGEGTVTGTEIEDEESYYEVEVTLDDGRQVDVQLDEDFVVVGTD